MDTSLRTNSFGSFQASPLIALIAVPLIAVVSSGTILSQPIGPDIRMLDLVPLQLPGSDIRIGDASTIDSVHLAVWGCLQKVPGDLPVPALVVEGTRATQRYLTDVQARPFNRVAVLSTTDRFLILWNDRRVDAPGIWGQFLGPDGSALSQQRLIIGGGEMSAEPLAYDTNSVTTLLIPQERGGEHVVDLITVDRAGLPINPVRQIRSGTIDLLRTFRLRRGGLFAHVDGDAPIVISADGKLYSHSLPEGRFDRPFVFDGATGMITTISGVGLVRYDSLHDVDPVWTIPGISGIAIGRDSLGWYSAGFRGGHVQLNNQFLFVIQREYVDLDLLMRVRTEFDTVAGPVFPSGTSDPSLISWASNAIQMGDGLIRLVGQWTVELDPHGSLEPQKIMGEAIRDFRAYAGDDILPSLSLQSKYWDTSDSAGIVVTTPGSSFVRVIRYGSETPELIDSGSTDRPVLIARRGDLFAGGSQSRGLFAIQFPGGDLSRRTPLPFQLLTPNASGYRVDSYVRGWRSSGYLQGDRRTRTYRDGNDIVRNTEIDHFWWDLDTAGWSRLSIASLFKGGPTDYGEAPLPSVAYDPGHHTQMWFSSFTAGGSARGGFLPASSLATRHIDDETVSRASSPSASYPPGCILPVDFGFVYHLATDGEFRSFGESTRWFGGGPFIPSISPTVLQQYDSTGLQRLFGRQFVLTAMDTSASMFTLVAQRLDGPESYVRYIPVSETTEHPLVIQRESDSLILVLYDHGSGPVVSLFGQRLQPVATAGGMIVERIPVSEGVAPARDIVAEILGDTLYIAWTDERTGVPQAFINAWVIPSRLNVENEPRSPHVWHSIFDNELKGPDIDDRTPEKRLEQFGLAIFGVVPNPAYGRVHMIIGSDVTRGIWVRQYDALGRLLGSALLDVLPGVHEYELPEVYSSSGLYYIELSTGEHRESVPVFVYRE